MGTIGKFIITSIVTALIGLGLQHFFFSDVQNMTFVETKNSSKYLEEIRKSLTSSDKKTSWHNLLNEVDKLNKLVKGFDEFYSEEAAIEMAKSLTTILISDPIAKSYLDSLGIENYISFYDSSNDFKPLPPKTISFFPFVGLIYMHAEVGGANEGMRYIPRIKEGYIKRVTNYKFWSSKIVMNDYEGGKFNRIDVIKAVNYIAGGVPNNLFYSKAYKKLSSSRFFGGTIGNTETGKKISDTSNRADFVVIRAIAEELLLSFAKFRTSIKMN